MFNPLELNKYDIPIKFIISSKNGRMDKWLFKTVFVRLPSF